MCTVCVRVAALRAAPRFATPALRPLLHVCSLGGFHS